MKRKAHERRRETLIHPPTLRPEDLLSFIQLQPFEREWVRLDLTDDDLRALELLIMATPTAAPVVSGTGGLRKLRFSNDLSRGKSGGVRVCYAYYPDFAVVVLALVYSKSEADDLSFEDKRLMKFQIERFGRLLAEGRIRMGRAREK